MASKDQYQEVSEENAQLQLEVAAGGVICSVASDVEVDQGSTDKRKERLSEQSLNDAQVQALKLELENRRLSSLVESLKEKKSFHESASRVLELETENKMLSLKVESLNDNNKHLELVCKQTLEEYKKLQAVLSSRRDKRQRDIQQLQTKLAEVERNYESIITKERLRLQTLLESVEKRAEDAERTIASKEKEVNELKLARDTLSREAEERQEKLEILEASLENNQESFRRECTFFHERVREMGQIMHETQCKSNRYQRKLSMLERAHEELNHDHKWLQQLHEQLNAEYKCLSCEKEDLKTNLRDSKNEARLSKESVERLEAKCVSLQAVRDVLLEDF